MIFRKNSWHYRLHTFISPKGVAAYENNLCPYFWLTIFYLIVFPIAFLFKQTRASFAINDPVKAAKVIDVTCSVIYGILALFFISTLLIAIITVIMESAYIEILIGLSIGLILVFLLIGVAYILILPFRWFFEFVSGRFCPRITWDRK